MSFASLMNAAGLVPPAVPAAPWGAGGSPPMPTSVTPGFTDNFPVLTEEVGYPPSPLAASGGGGSKQGSNGRGTSMGPMVTRALQDALGWKIKPGDSAGFMGALNQSFQLSLVEGHVASKWTPRSYAVQSDLSGGITGAQASVYTLAKTLVDQALPLINGLYALDPAADQEYVTALKQLATDQLTSLCQEIGYLGGPRVMRVHQYFQMLMGGRVDLNLAGPPPIAQIVPPPPPPPPPNLLTPPPYTGRRTPSALLPNFFTNPDTIYGTLGNLRDVLGLQQLGPGAVNYINTVDDETNVTNFRIVVDYVNSLWYGWANNIQFFITTLTPFLGTQLVIISRQLGVISEAVNEVRFVLNSVFIGPSERQTIVLNLGSLVALGPPLGPPALTPFFGQFANVPPIYLEDLLSWTQGFVADEAPGIIQSGGKVGLGEEFCAMIWQLSLQIWGTLYFAQTGGVPVGLTTLRVATSMQKLAGTLYPTVHARLPSRPDLPTAAALTGSGRRRSHGKHERLPRPLRPRRRIATAGEQQPVGRSHGESAARRCVDQAD